MTPTATPFDPFASHATFKYPEPSTVKAAYPLSKKSKVPDSIVRPNYARESVRDTLAYWWQVRLPLRTPSCPLCCWTSKLTLLSSL